MILICIVLYIVLQIAFLTLHNIFILDVIIIIVFHRCVYEMYVAQTLDKEVILCPYVHDNHVELGYLEFDVCIANINIPVNSRDAKCGLESDMIRIHAAILSKSQKAFEDIDASVEGIRLNKLLKYDFEKIEGFEQISCYNNCYDGQKNVRRKAVKLLASSITIMVKRVHSLKVPNFNIYLIKSWLCGVSEPIDVFRKWNEDVKNLISKNC